MAVKIIKDLVREVEAGETFVGTVTRMLTFGVFIEVLPGKEGLLHVSEISNYRVPSVEDAFEIGEKVLVTVKEIDDMHRVNLSRKKLLDRLDELALEPEFRDQIPVEKAREERYSQFPRGGGERREGGRGDRGGRDRDRDRGERRERDQRHEADDFEEKPHRPARRFERERKN